MGTRAAGARAGFTVIELVIGLAVGSVLLLVVGLLSRAGLETRREMVATGEMVAQGAEAERILRAEIEGAGQGLFSTVNISALTMQMGVDPEVEDDRVLRLRAAGPAYPHSAQACPSGSPGCLLLVGESSVVEGEILLAGTPGLGGRLLRVVGRGTPIELDCGTDCGERLSLDRVTVGSLEEEKVVGHVLEWEDGIYSEHPGGCPAPSPADPWVRCIEVTEMQTVGVQEAYGVSTVGGENWTYTPIQVADLTGILGLPEPPIWRLRSDGGGGHRVYSQPVEVARFRIDPRPGGRSVLVRDLDPDDDGAYSRTEALAYGVVGMVASVQHRGETELVRAMGFVGTDLAPGPANPNFQESGYYIGYRRSAGTLASARVRLRVEEDGPGGRSRGLEARETTLTVHVATPQILDGGVLRLAGQSGDPPL